MAHVKLQLANEEAARSGFNTNAPHTPSTFIMLGLDLEQIQYVTCLYRILYLLTFIMICRRDLYLDVKEKRTPTILQTANFQERRVSIRKKIQHFRELQIDYMPGLRSVLSNPNILDDSPDILAECIRLHLPSELSTSNRDCACADGIADIEARIRHADTSEALDDLRRYLRTRTFLNKWRVKNVSGQHQSTRTRGLQHTVDLRVHSAKTRYRHSRNACLVLKGHGDWERELKELKDEDVRALNERTLTEHEKDDRVRRMAMGTLMDDDSREGVAVTGALGEGRRTLSWIWFTVGDDENSPDMHEGELTMSSSGARTDHGVCTI
jgi:hypothetical protein